MSRTKKIAILAIIAMVLTLMPTALFAATADDTRLAGSTRIETALEIASAGWAAADAVVLAPANDANLVDALAAAPLAGQENAPILLTYVDSLNADVKARIAALGATKVYVIGAISDAVAAEVDAIDNVTVEVLKGANRIATAAAVNAKLAAPAGTFVVGFDATPDALSVASYAAKNKYAIVLANYDGSVDSAVLVGATTYIVGGPTLVKDITGATRMYGADRFATNADVASKLSFSYDKVYVANGVSLVDALAVAPLAAKADAFVALASATDVAAKSVVNEKISASTQVIAVGGTGVVSDAVRDKIGFESSEPQVAAVTVKNYDDDTSDQYIEFTVNGKKADINALNADGWDVEFFAYSAKTGGSDKTPELFADVTTGLLNNNLVDGTNYYVQVVLTKGADIVASELAKVSIKNLNLVATGISGYKLTNDNVGGVGTYTMDSTKLVVGEVATFDKITVTNGSAKEDVFGDFSIKTSDAGVISKTGMSIRAESPGTATVTITYGGATKSISFTVVNDVREIDKVRVKKDSDRSVVTSVRFATSSTNLVVEGLDQYGDPSFRAGSAYSSNTGVVSVGYTASSGALVLTKGSTPSGTATINFYEGADNTTAKIGSISVTTSSNDTVAKKSLDMWKPATDTQAAAVMAGSTKAKFSVDTTIDKSDDLYVAYTLNEFTSDGLAMGATVLTSSDYEVLQSPSGVVTPSLQDGGKKIVLKAEKAGTATLKVTDPDDGKIRTVRITVVDQGYSIKSVSWKSIASPSYARTFDWKAALNYNATGNNPIITGITLNKTAPQAIRLVDVLGTDNGVLYIDKNSNGLYDGDTIDQPIGQLEIVAVGFTATSNGTDGVSVVAGNEGTVIYKIWNMAGDKVLASKSVTINL